MADYNNNDMGSDRSARVRLKVLGISYSQIQNGAYALILAQTDGPYRIPVVVGQAEAQSIAIKMEGIVPPRPMTHDLFASLAHAYGLNPTGEPRTPESLLADFSWDKVPKGDICLPEGLF